MAIPSFVQASTGTTDATGTFTFTGVATGTIGDVVIVHIVVDGSGAISWGALSGTNINDLAGSANVWTEIGTFHAGAAVQQRIFIGRRTSASAAPTFTAAANTSGDDVYGRMYEFTDVSAGTTLTTVIENATAGGTSTSGATASGTIADASVQTLGPDRLALNFIGINDDNAIDVLASSGLQGWTEPTPEYADATGTDASVGIQTAFPASINTGQGTSGNSVQGSGGTNEAKAQQFTTSGALSVAHVTSTLRKNGTPTDNLVIEIQTDSGGLPSGTAVGTGGSIAGASLIDFFRNYRVAVSASLSAATTYHLVWRRDGARDTLNYFLTAAGGDSLTTAGTGVENLASGTWVDLATSDQSFALHTATDVSAGATVDGATTANVDATDTWGVVGFALIGTTVVSAATSDTAWMNDRRTPRRRSMQRW